MIGNKYVKDKAEEMTEEDLDKALKDRQKIEEKISKSGVLRKYVQIAKYMFLMLNDYRRGKYKSVPWLTISTLIFILLYILNPLDIVPDFIPVVGYVDDVTVLALGLSFVQKDLRKYLDWKYGTEDISHAELDLFD